jgi:molecular chaperone HtpG
MLFSSTENSNPTPDQTLDSYLERASDDQDKIYYCVADTFEAAMNSPHIEGLKNENKEVLLLTDRIDEWLMATLMEYKGKELVNVAKDIQEVDSKPEISESDQDFIGKIQKQLEDRVSDVAISSRLVDSASCLRLPNNEPGAQLRKILEASGQDLGEYKPIFEINLKHKLSKRLKDLKGKQFNLFVDFLYDYAVIAEGGSPKDPAKYLRQLDKYLS